MASQTGDVNGVTSALPLFYQEQALGPGALGSSAEDTTQGYLQDVFSTLDQSQHMYDFQLTKVFHDNIIKRISPEVYTLGYYLI